MFTNEASQVFPPSHTLTLGAKPWERQRPHQEPARVWECSFELDVSGHSVCCSIDSQYRNTLRAAWQDISLPGTGTRWGKHIFLPRAGDYGAGPLH